MCSLIGFGNWSRYFLYILISDLARFLKDDILGVGSSVRPIIVDLRIVFHPIIILLIGFTSDFIISMIFQKLFNF